MLTKTPLLRAWVPMCVCVSLSLCLSLSLPLPLPLSLHPLEKAPGACVKQHKLCAKSFIGFCINQGISTSFSLF